ncbi:MAG: redoxin domain-containing protein [Rickettsiales bacterium]
MMRVIPFVIFLCLSAALAVLLLYRVSNDAPSDADKPFPALRLMSLDGKTAWKQDALQGRVTIVNFYASWCSPCALEMPELVALKKQYPKVHIAGVAWNDEAATLQKWLKQHGNPFDSLWLDKNGDATIDLGIKGIPETIVVDGKGVVRARLAAPLTQEMRNGEFGQLIATLQGDVDAQ